MLFNFGHGKIFVVDLMTAHVQIMRNIRPQEVKGLPNIKSAIKRVEVTKTKTLKNTMRKSALKTAIKKCNESIEKNDEKTPAVLNNTAKLIDKAAAKHVLHKNTAARRKSRLARAMNAAAK